MRHYRLAKRGFSLSADPQAKLGACRRCGGDMIAKGGYMSCLQCGYDNTRWIPASEMKPTTEGKRFVQVMGVAVAM